jgi:type IV pilus assembly protein PilE
MVRKRRTRRKQGGFTLIELLIVVALIAILAAIAIPSFFGESKKSKARSEVSSMFGEFAIREEQYKLENGAYLAAATCPASPAQTGQDASACVAAGQPWANLKVKIDYSLGTTTGNKQNWIGCTYAITTGTGAGTNNPNGFTFASPPGAWFYILATCDTDGKPALNSTYFTSSVVSQTQALNEGN